MIFLDNYIKWKVAILYPSYLKWRKKIEDESLLSIDELNQLNWQRCKAIFDYSFTNIPFYQRKYREAGVSSVADVVSPEDFSRLPILTKDEIRHCSSKMIAAHDSLKKLSKVTTGGSTGEPLSVYQDPSIPYYYFSRDIFATWGIRISDNSARLNRHVPSRIKRVLSDVFLYPQKKCYLDANKLLSVAAMQGFTQEIGKVRPTYLKGYLGAVLQYATYCEEHHVNIPSLKAVWTSSAPLTEQARQYMEGVFKCKVYTQYGCCEIPHLASECCKQKGMHINHNFRKIDIVDDHGKTLPIGTHGNVVITNLVDFRFPLIRYQNGDTSQLLSRQCTCGLNYPLMEYVRGRISDTLILPDKSGIAGDFLTTVFDAWPNAVKAFQFVQKKDGRIILNVVPNQNYVDAQKEIEIVHRRMKEIIAGKCSFELQQVAAINHDRGKQRYIIREFSTDE